MGDAKRQQAMGQERTAQTLRIEVDPTKIRPLGEAVLIEQLPEGRTAAGIVLPDSVKLRNRALVHAVGDGHLCENGTRVPLGVKAGDVVVVANNTPGQLMGSVNGNPLALVNEGHLLAVDTANYDGLLRVLQ